MDGQAIMMAFGSLSGPDCLKSVVKRCGYRLKVYNSLKSIMSSELNEVSGSQLLAAMLQDTEALIAACMQKFSLGGNHAQAF